MKIPKFNFLNIFKKKKQDILLHNFDDVYEEQIKREKKFKKQN
ncbi:MAG: hypothetical protein PHO23_01870 [Candidatus Pacebacteria bacterium]|nr:hypothetical protein [Candidatus Paceibacterota bacterium]